MAATRLNVITYAGLAMGASTSYDLTGFRRKDGQYETLTVEFTVRIADSNPTTFRTLWQALETALRTPNGDLLINLGGSTETWSHDSNTGFNAKPSFELLEEGYTKSSRRYRCTIELQLPADESGKGGRQSGSFSYRDTPSGVRTVTIQAVYTALSGNSATEQVDDASGFAAYVSEVQTLLGGTWDDPSDYAVTPDDEDKVATVVATYIEVIYDQSLSALNDADFVQPQVSVSTIRSSVPQLTGSGARPPVFVDVSFFTNVKKTNQDLESLIYSKVIPYMREVANTFAIGPGTMTAVASTLRADPHSNTISGSVRFRGDASSIVSVSLATTEILDTGTELVALHDERKFSKVLEEGPAHLYRQIELEVKELDTGQDALSGHAIMSRAVTSQGGGWFLKNTVQRAMRTEEDLPDIPDGRIKLVTISSAYLMEYGVVKIRTGGSGQTRTRKTLLPKDQVPGLPSGDSLARGLA